MTAEAMAQQNTDHINYNEMNSINIKNNCHNEKFDNNSIFNESVNNYNITNSNKKSVGIKNDNQIPIMSVIITIRLLMQGKEVGSIIGKRGDHVKQIRETSGAKINISDGSCPERIVTITGNISAINNAFGIIARKFEEDLQALPNSVPKPPITMRIIVPTTQCGSLIGKGGSKIKEIREKTGVSIQVATEMLPSSTERAVTISGTCEALIDCMQEICQILLKIPAKDNTLLFRPKPSYNPLVIASSAAVAAVAAQQQNLTAFLLQQQQQHQANITSAIMTAQEKVSTPKCNTQTNKVIELTKLQPFVDTTFVNQNSTLYNLPNVQDSTLTGSNITNFLNNISSTTTDGFSNETFFSPQILPCTNLLTVENTPKIISNISPCSSKTNLTSPINLASNRIVFTSLPQIYQQQLQLSQLDAAALAALSFTKQQQFQQQQSQQRSEISNNTLEFLQPWIQQQQFTNWNKQHQLALSFLQQQQQQKQLEILQNLCCSNLSIPYIINGGKNNQKLSINETKIPSKDLHMPNDLKKNNRIVALNQDQILSGNKKKRYLPY